MSRMTLCLVTAAVLAGLSLGVMALRYHVMGSEITAPTGPGTYHVTLLVRGKASGEVRITTACPLDCGRQHVFREEYQSDDLGHRPGDPHRPDRRLVQWSAGRLAPGTAFQARYEFFCRVNVHHPTAAMTMLAEKLDTPPAEGEYLKNEPHVESSDPAISQTALDLTASLTRPADQARALFQYVSQEIGNEPAVGGPGLGAVECLKAGRGDAAAKSRLLAALCRNRGIPTRLVTGLTLNRAGEQKGHTWIEAWVDDHWTPFCPFHHHCGRVPPTYLVFGFGDLPLARGKNVHGLTCACLAEHRPPAAEAEVHHSLLHSFFERISLYNLPPSETGLVEFLLLLPVAALIICLFRNVIGLQSFGTFAPALIGLAFRHAGSLPGLLVFVSIVLVGWGMRRVLDRYHLLQVPRIAFLLSMVVVILLVAVLIATFHHLSPTRYIALFPMVILTSMIERFWTLETEDGTFSSFKTLLGTIFIAGTISLILGLPEVRAQMFRYPETLGLIMALELLLGRYTGYRLSELFRFRDLLGPRGKQPQLQLVRAAPLSMKVIRAGREWRTSDQ
jgi:hypothetical protein